MLTLSLSVLAEKLLKADFVAELTTGTFASVFGVLGDETAPSFRFLFLITGFFLKNILLAVYIR